MSSLEEIRSERIKKLEALKNKGINPYPVFVPRDFAISEVLADFSKLSKKKKPLRLAGRIIAIRGHGGAIFFDFFDGGGKLQAYIKKDEIGTEEHKLFLATVDIGDFIGLSGSLFTTKKKEKTLMVKKWKMLAKSLRPLPDKWHGLQDVEERYRKRYLDLLMNSEVKERFLARSKIISEIRNILTKEKFLEVETPILQHLAGGALAEPFKTRHNALDIDLYLRVAPELYLKKLLMGGFEKIYEMGRNFRNEGIDATHNPEFTMLELYAAYYDAEQLREFTEKFLSSLTKKTFGKNQFEFGGNKISLGKKFNTLSYYDVLKSRALIISPEKAPRADFALKAKQFGIKVEDFETKEKIMDNIFKKVCRPKIIQPTFIVDYPVGASPLAKRKEDDKKLIDRFQLVVGGMEIVNGFSELNDPIDQRERFAEQDKAKEAGEKDVSPSEEDYLEAMVYG
ncbi:MAG TPA: lysine--tRNA ligase, partial [bacterium]|nr:lysine--tRNA ligase [bacterium]